MQTRIVKLPRSYKRIISIAVDVVILWIAVLLAYFVRLAGTFEETFLSGFQVMLVLAPVTAIPFYARLGLYRAILRYMDVHVLLTIVKACSLGALVLAGSLMFAEIPVPRSVPVLYWLFSVCLITSSRYFVRYWLWGHRVRDLLISAVAKQRLHERTRQGIPIVIYGAGATGAQLFQAMERSIEYRVVAFVDDDRSLAGNHLFGCPIWHSDKLNELMNACEPSVFMLAMPSATHFARKQVVQKLEALNVQVQSVPALADLASGKLSVQQIQDVDIGDLLGRDAVSPDQSLLTQNVTGKVVMVTGAGGSIGSEICRQVMALKPSALILLEHSEFNLYVVDRELREMARQSGLSSGINLVTVLGSVNDPARLLDTMYFYKVQTVYHAAAYKHVPMVEQNLSQGLRNNVLGTLYTAQAAIAAGVERFVLISTDKAVRPTNVMGASKRLSEMVLQALSQEDIPGFYHEDLFKGCGILHSTDSNDTSHSFLCRNQTQFTIVRFGNVLGSSGSVIPVFRQQIAAGGPVTVTHPDINRFFMTIPEAAQLVMQAGAMGQGGDVFVLDMGTPVVIADLARRMIKLSGLTVKDDDNPEGDIEITYSGLRPGEKLYEELLIGDNAIETNHEKIFSAREEHLSWQELQLVLDDILNSLKGHQYEETRELLLKYVNGYKPSDHLVDWLFQSPETETSALV